MPFGMIYKFFVMTHEQKLSPSSINNIACMGSSSSVVSHLSPTNWGVNKLVWGFFLMVSHLTPYRRRPSFFSNLCELIELGLYNLGHIYLSVLDLGIPSVILIVHGDVYLSISIWFGLILSPVPVWRIIDSWLSKKSWIRITQHCYCWLRLHL